MTDKYPMPERKCEWPMCPRPAEVCFIQEWIPPTMPKGAAWVCWEHRRALSDQSTTKERE